MATRYIDFLVTGDPVTARATAEQALIARKFGVSWHDDWTATAERGSKTANLIVGSLAQYFKVGVRLMSAQPGETTLRIERQSSEWMGGAIGAARTNKNLASLRVELEATFAAAGVLRGVSEGQPAPAPPCAWRDAVKHALGTGLVVIGQDPVGLRGSQLTSRTHSRAATNQGRCISPPACGVTERRVPWSDVRGREKVPACGRLEVPAGGHVVPTPR